MSRLLAKMALERCFNDFERRSKDPEALILDPYFNNLRRWARYGDNFASWPYHQRTIYPEEAQMRHPTTNEWVKAGIGQGLFHTPSPETYFSISLYGVEFVINVGGPNIDGLNNWLRANNNVSPYLHFSGLQMLAVTDNGEVRIRLERISTE